MNSWLCFQVITTITIECKSVKLVVDPGGQMSLAPYAVEKDGHQGSPCKFRVDWP